jgi:septal ring factor EnvC (AmiA/AmiB activator)
MRRLVAILLCCFAITALYDASARQQRSSKDVRRARKQTEQQIAQTQSQIKANDAETRKQLRRLESLQANMSLRADTIATLTASVSRIDHEIALLNDSIKLLDARSKALQAGYASSLRTMRSRRQGMSDIAFIFSANTFSQAWRRIRYLRTATHAMTRQAAKVKETANRLASARQHLDSLAESSRTTLASLNRAQATMATERNSANTIVSSLKKQNKSLTRELQRRRDQAAALDRELQQIIDREAREAAERARKEAQEQARREAAERQRREAEERQRQEAATAAAAAQKDKNSAKAPAQPAAAASDAKPSQNQAKASSKSQTATPAKAATPTPAPAPAAKPDAKPAAKPAYSAEASQDRRLSGSFTANKGKLLFPVAGKYSITSYFGTNSHPDLAKVQYENAGIDIVVPQGTSARAVFEGVVSSIFRLDGYQNVVILRHGEYLTVYAGIGNLAVKKGDKVSTGQTLGTIFTDPDDSHTALHFEIRHEKQKLNPIEWVK